MIIAVVIGGGSILIGVWNWLNYYKDQAIVSGAVTQSLRPPPNPEVAALEQSAGGAAPAPALVQLPAGQAAGQADSGEVVRLPDTVGRNPFFSWQEIRAIETGEFNVQEAAAAIPGPSAALPEYRLNGLVLDNVSGEYRAIIDGKAYGAGDSIGLEKVVRITPSTVELQYGDRQRTLSLRQAEKKADISITVKKKP
ncbi:MAG: hypothetical protein V1794_06340 [Candidatus Glassbacteria bacterium]